MQKPAISVAMSVYNNEEYLAEAIESILIQTFRDFEFLILNDGSTDRSKAIIDSFAAKDSRIRPIHRKNKGLIVSLNQLIDESRAPLIARMDGDDICLPERFEKQIAFMEANPDYGVVGTWTKDIDGNGNDFPMEGPDQPTDHDSFLKAIGHSPLVCHPSAMMRRALVQKVGGYHPAFRHCEDFDLWLRLSSVTKICSLPERLLKYRHTDGQVSNRHIIEQQTGAAYSYLAFTARENGQPDPTENLEKLPPISEADTLFGMTGAGDEIIERLVHNIVYSPVALKSDAFDYLLNYVKNGGSYPNMWRSVARLVRFGEPVRALKIANYIITA